ncbi:MAG: thioredoxin family protein [Candidatus Micrarchaeota archaeon]|nr:thioredoxin family protein [Candidatus Micrarchaeota archaeon]
MVLLQSEEKKLKPGDRAPGFSLIGTDGKRHSLEDYEGARALLVVFTCNHCPYAQAKFGRMNEIAAKYEKFGVKVVGINPNDSSRYPEDSFENMKKVARALGFKFDYLYDETQEVAKKYGAVCTPDPFLFDSEFRLAYHGRLDDALSPEKKPSKFIMEEAIDAVLAGRKPPYQFLHSQGCSIKWRE